MRDIRQAREIHVTRQRITRGPDGGEKLVHGPTTLAQIGEPAATLQQLHLSIEQIEDVLGHIGDSFALRFPEGTLDEILRLEELCMTAAWAKGLYKRPEFLSDAFAATCRGANPGLA
jgi:hypothetical protein